MARLVLQSQGQSGLTGTLTRVSDGTAVQLYSDVAQTITVSQPVTLSGASAHYYFTAPAATDITAKLLNGSTVVNFLTERPSNEDQMVLTPYVPPPVVPQPTYGTVFSGATTTWTTGATVPAGIVDGGDGNLYLAPSGYTAGASLAADIAAGHLAMTGSKVATRSILSFGAKVDGRTVTGISVTGTACTAATATFSASDVGRTIAVYDGGGLIGQAPIQTYTDSTHVTLATSITTSSGKSAVIGTDDTAAWQAAITWAYSSFAGGVVTYDGNGISLIAGPQVSGNVTSTNGPAGGAVYPYSGQILLPAVPIAHGQKIAEIRGNTPFAGIWSPLSGVGDDTPSAAGLILFSTATSGAVIDVISDPQGFVFAKGSFSFLQLNLRRVTLRTIPKASGGPKPLSLVAAASCSLQEVNVDLALQATTWPPTVPATSTDAGYGVVLPGSGNWGLVELLQSQVTGYAGGVAAAGSAHLDNVSITHCGAGLGLGDASSGARTADGHGAHLHNVLLLGNTYDLLPRTAVQVSGEVEVEPAGTAFLDDTTALLSGQIQVGGITGTSLKVNNVGGTLVLSTVSNPVRPGPRTPVADTLIRSGSITAFGLADGSNHGYFISGMATTSTGAHASSSGNRAIAIVSNGPKWRSRKISATLLTSPNAGSTWIGLGLRGINSNGDMLKFICSNGSFGVGAGFYKGSLDSNVLMGSLSTAVTFAVNTSYAIDFTVQTNAASSSDVLLTGYVNGIRVVTYTLSSAEATTYPSTGFDAIVSFLTATVDDGNSRLSNLSITEAPDLPYVTAGTTALVGGTKAVANTAITASSKVRVFNEGASGTVGALSVALNPGTGFTINSSSGTDTSTIYYEVVAY